ncbi:hypothetical protein IWQ60_005882 [Tieghemiomyces parasiticus]|uniref:Corrinoid adenosyltransferase MMAB n=1 Tax=Tieghemiomyces parasiticus TaxID=78921 RepID=A0A9W8A5C4_9FUNG|nr:hypothetical protein IWQ60_005882 [Tieghemiomyces parasiticus]
MADSLPKSQLYTRTGDKGTSSLYTGARRSKSDIIFEALGTVDELNSTLGIAHHYCHKIGNGLHVELEEIQCRMIEIGSCIATPPEQASERKVQATRFDAEWVQQLETQIDRLDATLPPLKNFILPSGGESAVFLHQCRSICRRAERTLVTLAEQSHAVDEVTKYINRLSDYLFAAARFAAHFEKRPETLFKAGAKTTR